MYLLTEDNWRDKLRSMLQGMDMTQLIWMLNHSLSKTETVRTCSFDPNRHLIFLVELFDEITNRRIHVAKKSVKARQPKTNHAH